MNLITGDTSHEANGNQRCPLIESRSRIIHLGNQELRPITFEQISTDDLNRLCYISAEGFRKESVTKALISDVGSHLRGANLLYLLYTREEEISGFICLDVFNTQYQGRDIRVLQIQGIVLSSLAKGLGIYIVEELVNSFNIDAIAFHTVSEPMRRLGDSVNGRYDYNLAIRIAERLGSDVGNIEIRHPSIDYTLVVERERYGGPLYGQPLNGKRVLGITEEEELLGHAGVFVFLL